LAGCNPLQFCGGQPLPSPLPSPGGACLALASVARFSNLAIAIRLLSFWVGSRNPPNSETLCVSGCQSWVPRCRRRGGSWRTRPTRPTRPSPPRCRRRGKAGELAQLAQLAPASSSEAVTRLPTQLDSATRAWTVQPERALCNQTPRGSIGATRETRSHGGGLGRLYQALVAVTVDEGGGTSVGSHERVGGSRVV